MFEKNQTGVDGQVRHVLVASHQRSGTHLTIDTLRANFAQLANEYINIDRMLPKHAQFLGAAECRALIEKDARRNIVKTHATPALTEFASDGGAFALAKHVMDTSRILYVYRDGRDVLASLYHFEKNSVPRPPERSFAEFLRAPSLRIPDGWPSDTTPADRWARHASEWLDVQGCLGISYEDMLQSPETTVRKLAEFLGLPVPQTARRVELHRPSLLQKAFRRLTGTQFASSAVLPRKGVIGDWVNSFSKEDEALFWDRAGAVMHRLGYR